MRNTVWNYLHLWRVNFNYYDRCRHEMERLNSVLKFGSAFVTMVAIACWGYFPKQSLLWAGLITLTQVTSLYAECTDLSGKILRLNYWSEDAYKTINKITSLWDEVDELSDHEIRKRMDELRDEWSALDARFIRGINPYKGKVLEKAEEEADDFLKVVHIANHGNNDEKQEEVVL